MALQARDIDSMLHRWPDAKGGSATLINHSENQTFRIDQASRPTFALRLHRPHYQSRRSIESELDWLAALRQDTDLPVPEPVPGADGCVLQALPQPDGSERLAVLFRHIAGAEPTPASDLTPIFATLGRYAARLHLHSLSWHRPRGFHRQAWHAASILDVDGLWGDWRQTPGVIGPVRAVLDRVDKTLWHRLAEYGTGPDRYGLIHADMRLGNLLVDRGQVTLIDFDDCGHCWFGYDFAAAISFHETSSAIPAMRAAWLEAYRAIRPLSSADVAALDSLVLLRRMALLAWIGSHADTALAQQHAPGFVEATAGLADRYLRGRLFDA